MIHRYPSCKTGVMSHRLDIDALQALCAIADHGGVTRAAARLSLSQSAVSHKIKRLEEHIGRPLLARRPGGPVFTGDGETLLAYARRILSLHDEAVASLATSPLTGRIRLGMTEDVISGGLSTILGRFARLHPDVAVHTHVGQSLTLEAELESGEIDLAVMQRFKHAPHPADIVLFEDALHWVKSADLRLDETRPVPFLAFDGRCFYRKWAMDMVAPRGAGFVTVLECASVAGMVSGIQAGLGVALLNARHVTAGMEVIDHLFDPPPAIAYVVRIGRRSRSEATRALAGEIARENGRQHGGRTADDGRRV
ncbi:LysR family transcriptional regulator [Azospirillum sp. A39]|uniref:LysR family transcriptional regulator n=1 Tax=Azospirillum sp. A39 TaxID=3462279 RepID=UPI0040451FAF